MTEKSGFFGSAFGDRPEKTEYLVEADSFAHQVLWERYAAEAYEIPSRFPRYFWDDPCKGINVQIGELAGLPVTLTLSWHVVEEVVLCFYFSPSRVTDRQMVRDFLAKHFPNVPICDASNFHHALEVVRRRVEAEREQAG